jgi:C4-dicarboxylate-specific signal transduction histidine kinase
VKIKSLKNNILIYLLVFTIVPLLIGSSVILYNVYNSEKKNIFYNHSQYLAQAKEEINTLLMDIEDKALYVKEKYSLHNDKLINGLLRVSQNINTIMILDNEGILLDSSASSVKSNIFVGYDYSNTKYFKAIKKGKQSHWTEVYLSLESYTPSISYSIRIDENTIAILIINLSELDNLSNNFRSGDGSSMIKIIDKEGLFISDLEQPETVSQRKTIQDTEIYNKYIVKNITDKQIKFIDSANVENIGIYGISDKLHWGIIINEKSDYVFKTYYSNLWFICFFTLLLISISSYFSFQLSKSILRPLDLLSNKMDDIAQGNAVGKINENNYLELEKLSTNFLIMQKKIIDRENENRLKDKQIYDSTKMAQMGEMIGNIAHQWRQPLSVISTAASGMKMQKEYNVLNDTQFDYCCDAIVENTQFLSETIETFRNFLKDKKERKQVIIQDEVDSILKIISASLTNNHITLVNKMDYTNKVSILLSVGELSQVIINIMNNAKDILLEKKVSNPLIILKLFTRKENIILSIEDNAGGVPSDIISKIFDPYFTTKHQSQGTGLGLHMSSRIVTESLKGDLTVENTKYGAKFSIILPLK